MTNWTDDVCDEAISGLIRWRSGTFGEAEGHRDRIVGDDVDALDRILRSFGFEGDFDARMP